MHYNREKVPVNAVPLEVNPEYEKLLGIASEKMVEKIMVRAQSKLNGTYVDWIAILGRVAMSGVPEHFAVRYSVNQNFYQACVFSPKKGYCIVALRDISVKKQKTVEKLRKKAEQNLFFAEKKYRRLYETTQDGIMARDLRGKMIDCNPAYAKMLGYTKKELRCLSVKQLLPERWHEQREKVAKSPADRLHCL